MKNQNVLSYLAVFGAILGILGANRSFADTSAIPTNSRIIVGGKVTNPSGSTGTLLGFGDVHYEADGFFVGGAAYTGQLSGNKGSFTEGGVLVGGLYPLSANTSTNLIFQATLGAAGGSNSSTGAASFLIEPTVGLDFALGRSLHGVVDLGYSYLPAATNFSGLVVEFNIAFLN
jgi:hypothetical protein